MLRLAFTREVDRRFDSLRSALWQLIAVDDSFGLGKPTLNYDPNEARVPKGATGGGQWVKTYVPDKELPDDFSEYEAGPVEVVPIEDIIPTETLRMEPYDTGGGIQDSALTIKLMKESIEKGHSAREKLPPLLVYREDGKLKLKDGHHRLQAAKESSLTHVPVRVIIPTENQLTINAKRWRHLSDDQKVAQFKVWLSGQVQQKILTQQQGDDWWTEYIAKGYAKGAGRAFDEVRKPAVQRALKKPMDIYRGNKEEFLRSSFGRQVSNERVKILAARVLNELEGVTDAQAQQITRELIDGMAEGKSPRDVARQIVKKVDGIGKARARTIARTETVRAHNEGALDALEKLGVDKISVLVEWSTAQDEDVCKLCKPLQGLVIPIKLARGMFPRHPNCRCVPIPANVGENDPKQLRKRRDIDRAILKSLRAGAPKKKRLTDDQLRRMSDWIGARKKFPKKLPRSLV